MGVTLRMSDGSYRSFTMQTVTWWDREVGTTGLPVVVIMGDSGWFVGRNPDGPDLMAEVDFQSAFGPDPEDAFVIVYLEPARSPSPPPTAPDAEAVDLDSFAPDWDVGFNRPDSDPQSTIDVELFWAALEKAEAMLQHPFDLRVAAGLVTPPTDAEGNVLPVFDRSRIYALGWGTGGVHLYRVLSEEPPEGWAIRAACIVNGTIGGYMHRRDYGIVAHREVWWGRGPSPYERATTVPQPAPAAAANGAVPTTPLAVEPASVAALQSPLVAPPQPAILHIRGANDAIMANATVESGALRGEEYGAGDNSMGSSSIYARMDYDAGGIADLARFDFFMEVGLDDWCGTLFGNPTLFSDQLAAVGFEATTDTNVQAIAFDASGALLDVTLATGIPVGKLVGVLVTGLGHGFPKLNPDGDPLFAVDVRDIWAWFKAAP